MEQFESFVEGTRIRVGGGSVFLNPGTGPVEDATEENAIANIRPLLIDAGLDPDTVQVEREPERDRKGRYGFLLKMGEQKTTVDMPGLTLDRVRFLGEGEQNAWDFPRLYVDDASWLWLYAKSRVWEDLAG